MTNKEKQIIKKDHARLFELNKKIEKLNLDELIEFTKLFEKLKQLGAITERHHKEPGTTKWVAVKF